MVTTGGFELWASYIDSNSVCIWRFSMSMDQSKVFLKISRNVLAKFRYPHGGCQGENCDILKI